MLPPLISDAKGNHPTFILSVIRSRMLPPFISDAKDKHPTFIVSVIRSRMLPYSFSPTDYTVLECIYYALPARLFSGDI